MAVKGPFGGQQGLLFAACSAVLQDLTDRVVRPVRRIGETARRRSEKGQGIMAVVGYARVH